jgi:GNAT superfamily N-acetyltransferase
MPDLGLRIHTSLADAPVDDVVEVYRAAFTAPGYDETADDVERFRAGLPRHGDRDGFRLVVASRSDAGPTGFAYGYTGRRGQWWTDRLLERVPPDVTDEWADGHFEFVELAVLPSSQGQGIGQAFHDALLDGLPHQRVLLGTWTGDRPARRLYLRSGWRELARIDDDSALMGLELADRSGVTLRASTGPRRGAAGP